jgi:hypothetical protein
MPIGVARVCPPFALGCDSFEPLTAQHARIARAEGLLFVGRYVENLSETERDDLFREGLAIAPLTEAVTGIVLSERLGEEIGRQRAQQLVDLQCPPTVDLWADHESPARGSDSVGYLNARARAALAAGFGAGQYAGLPIDLTSAQLFDLLANRYWKGGGRVPEPDCGWCLVQAEPLAGVNKGGILLGTQRVDVDFAKEDYEGRSAVLWWPA